MKRLLTMTFLLVALLGTSAWATQTRVLTMGDNGMILVDDANIFMWPGRNFNYPDLAIGEFNTSDDFAQFGITWKFGEQKPWVLGTFFSTEDPVEPSTYDGQNLVSWDAGLLDNRRITVTYGRQFSQTNFGFNFGYISSSQSSEISTDASEEKFSQYLFGFGLTSAKGDWDIAAGIAFGSFTDKDDVGADETETDGYTDFMAAGRYFYQYSPKMTFVPHAQFAFGSHGAKGPGTNPFVAPADTIKSKLTAFGAGVGMHYTPIREVLAVIDLGFDWQSVTNETPGVTPAETKETELILPFWRIGLDAEVFNWLDVRMGATSAWSNFKFEDTANDFKQNHADNQTYLGAGLHFGKFHIDTYTDPEILLDGFNFISGSNDADDLNFQVSVLYEMF